MQPIVFCGNTQMQKNPDWRIFVPIPGISGWRRYRPGILWSVGGGEHSGFACISFLMCFAEYFSFRPFGELFLFPEPLFPD